MKKKLIVLVLALVAALCAVEQVTYGNYFVICSR